MTTPTSTPEPRRPKFAYGSNAAALAFFALALVILVNIFFAQFKTLRADLTSSGVNGLSPDTMAALKQLKGTGDAFTIVNMFETRVAQTANKESPEFRKQQAEARIVGDLLREFQRFSPNIKVVNPASQDEVERMIRARFEYENAIYLATLKELNALSADVTRFAEREGAAFTDLLRNSGPDVPDALLEMLRVVRDALADKVKVRLARVKLIVKQTDNAVLPRWENIREVIAGELIQINQEFSELEKGGQLKEDFSKESKTVQDLFAHLKATLPEITAYNDKLEQFIKKLGDLPASRMSSLSVPGEPCLIVFPPESGPPARLAEKITADSKSLKVKGDAGIQKSGVTLVLVDHEYMTVQLGEDGGIQIQTRGGESAPQAHDAGAEVIIVPQIAIQGHDSLFVPPPPGMGGSEPRFDGEPVLTAVLRPYGQTSTKYVVIVSNSLAVPEGAFTLARENLGRLNYRVSSWSPPGTGPKDRPDAPPEKELPDHIGAGVVWVVFSPGFASELFKYDDHTGAEALYDAVKKHIDAGGSAVFLAHPGEASYVPAAPPSATTEPAAVRSKYIFADLLDPFGLRVNPDYLVVNEAVVENEKTIPENHTFGMLSTTTYPDTEITRSLQSLTSAFGFEGADNPTGYRASTLTRLVDVITPNAGNAKPFTIVSIPRENKTYIELGRRATELPALARADKRSSISFRDKPEPEESGPRAPFSIAAASERSFNKGSQRVVVFGNTFFLVDVYVMLPKPAPGGNSAVTELLFPGNGELFSNAVQWAAGDEKLGGASAKANLAGKIQVNPGALAFINWGLLRIGLPVLALAAGALVYFARRR